MDFNQIRYFLSVANHLNFTTASKECLISQQGLSQQIKSMENELGFQLFRRNNRFVQLTPAGKAFMEDMKTIDVLYKKCVDKAAQISTGLMGTLSIGYSFSCHHVFFYDDQVIEFMKENPSISVSFEKSSTEILTRLLDRGIIDIAFLELDSIAPLADYIDSITIGTTDIVLAVSKIHPLASQKSISFNSLKEETLLLQESTAPFFLQLFYNNNVIPQRVETVNNFSTQLMRTSSGNGVTILPESTQHSLNTNLVFIPFEEETPTMDVCIVWKKTNDNPSLPLFINTVLGYL